MPKTWSTVQEYFDDPEGYEAHSHKMPNVLRSERAAARRMTFSDWLREVDGYLGILYNSSTDDLGDLPYWTMWNDATPPGAAARHLWQAKEATHPFAACTHRPCLLVSCAPAQVGGQPAAQYSDDLTGERPSHRRSDDAK